MVLFSLFSLIELHLGTHLEFSSYLVSLSQISWSEYFNYHSYQECRSFFGIQYMFREKMWSCLEAYTCKPVPSRGQGQNLDFKTISATEELRGQSRLHETLLQNVNSFFILKNVDISLLASQFMHWNSIEWFEGNNITLYLVVKFVAVDSCWRMKSHFPFGIKPMPQWMALHFFKYELHWLNSGSY